MLTPPADRFWGSGPDEEARFFLVGAPLDLTGSGRLGTSQAPSAIRRASQNIESYSPLLDGDLFDVGLADLGDLALGGLALEEALGVVEQQADALLERGVPIVMGGEHTIALGIGRAVKRRHPDAMVVSLDAHLDLADELDGAKLSHGTWACRLGEEVGLASLVILGVRSGTRDEWQRAHSCSWVCPRLELPPPVRSALAERPIYLSVDIDVLDPSAAPGTGTPEPPGVSSAALFDFLYSLRGLNVVALDVNEVLPEVDPAGITAVTAAKLIREAAILLGRRR